MQETQWWVNMTLRMPFEGEGSEQRVNGSAGYERQENQVVASP